MPSFRRASVVLFICLTLISCRRDPNVAKKQYLESGNKYFDHGRYRNPALDALLDDAGKSTDQDRRRADYVQAQQILARDLPAFNLWYKDSILVHNRRLSGIAISPSGSFWFLTTARVQM